MKRFMATLIFVLMILSACSAPTETSDAPIKPSNPQPEIGTSVPINSTDTVALSVLIHHYGAFPVDGQKPVKYDIKVYGNPKDDVGSHVVFTFRFGRSEMQSIRYDLENYPHIGAMDQGLVIMDMNSDGYQDIVLDIGIAGHMRKAVCYVFDPTEDTQNKYIPVSGFDQLASPRISISQADEVFVVADDDPGTLEGLMNGWSSYQINDSELVPVDFLTNDDVQDLQDLFIN